MLGRSYLFFVFWGLVACDSGTDAAEVDASGMVLDGAVVPTHDAALDVPDGGGAPPPAQQDGGEPAGDDGGGVENPSGDGGPDERLVVQGNHILLRGKPFHGRGANLHDVRSCSACSFAPPDPAGIDRWADELIDQWGANFIRFVLSSKSAPYNAYEVQWKNLVDDPAYLQTIVQNVAHMTQKRGVYVLVTLFMDPSIKPNNNDFDSEWPSSSGDSNSRYKALAEAFHDNPRVLFGLTNEPHTTAQHAAELAAVYRDAIAVIRAVEDKHGSPHHVVVVQAPGGWARDLSYFIAHPLTGDQIAYEVHLYNHASDFHTLLEVPSATLPMIIGEYGPADPITDSDIKTLWRTAQELEVPYTAWAFHHTCAPNLLVASASDGCGLSAKSGYNFPRTAWGDLLLAHLKTAW